MTATKPTDGMFDDLVKRLHVYGEPNERGEYTVECPLGKGQRHSMVVHPSRGWECMAACGRGSIEELARRLGPDGTKAREAKDSIPPLGKSVAERNFQPRPATELMAEESEETSWVWEGYVPEGGLVCLAALPKAGKSTLAYHLAKAVAAGLPFLGGSTRKAPVLILALEERRQDVANRLRRLEASEDVFVHVGPLRAVSSLEDIGAFVREKGVGLIVIDTLRRFWRVQDENDAALVGDAMAPILDLARDTGAAVLIVHHLRKSPGEEGTDIAGSGDIFAHVDVALLLRRRRDGKASERLLEAFSRYDATPSKVLIRLDGSEYECLGDAAEWEAKQLQEELVAALRGSTPQSPEALAEAADRPAPSVRRALNGLRDQGRVTRTGKGRKGDPYFWCLSEEFYSATQIPYGGKEKPGAGRPLGPVGGANGSAPDPGLPPSAAQDAREGGGKR